MFNMLNKMFFNLPDFLYTESAGMSN
jgi:hypothetical protein